MPDTHQDIDGLGVPPVFVGRRDELQALRNALESTAKTLYVWGGAGIGKSTLVARALTQLETDVDEILVIRCQEHPHPLSALAAIADLWRAHAGEAGHQAATLLLDARQAPAARARRALHILADRRDLLVFDNFDAWFIPDTQDTYPDGTTTARDISAARHVEDATLRELLLGLCTTHADTTLLFTARQRWSLLETLPANTRFELLVPLLKPNHAILLMNSLPHLNNETLDDKQEILRYIGGHPFALRLLDGWLDSAYELRDFLETASIKGQETESWLAHFVDALCERLDPGAYEALCAIAVWNAPFCAETIGYITAIQQDYAPALLQQWASISLITLFHHAAATNVTGDWYTLHPAVREHILTQTSPDATQDLHLQVAAYYGAPFVEEARRQIATRAASAWNEAGIQWLARSESGVLGMRIRQTHNFEAAREAVQQAILWAIHLLAAHEAEAAAQIIKTISPVLNRWGQHDLAKTLLQQVITVLDEPAQAEMLHVLARINEDTGHLDEAMQVYQSMYDLLDGSNTRPQQGHLLIRIAAVHQRLGEWENAIEKYTAALTIMQTEQDNTGEMICLRELSHLYLQTQHFELALEHSETVRMIYRHEKNLSGLVAINFEQGLIFKGLQRWREALERFHESMTTAQRLGDQLQVAVNLQTIADVLQNVHQTDEAVKLLQQALTIYRDLGNQWPRVVAILEQLGQIYERYGQTEQARQIYKRAAKVRERYQVV